MSASKVNNGVEKEELTKNCLVSKAGGKKKEVLDHILKCFPEFKMIFNVNVTEKIF